MAERNVEGALEGGMCQGNESGLGDECEGNGRGNAGNDGEWGGKRKANIKEMGQKGSAWSRLYVWCFRVCVGLAGDRVGIGQKCGREREG